jgi:hypothetical protein
MKMTSMSTIPASILTFTGIKTTYKIVYDLRSEDLEERHQHILTKRDTPLEDMPKASEFEKTEPFEPHIRWMLA